MPSRTKEDSADCRLSPPQYAGPAEAAATVARTAPAVLDLLADGVPRSGAAVVVALAGRHPREDVRTLMRLAVTGRMAEAGGRCTPGTAGEQEAG